LSILLTWPIHLNLFILINETISKSPYNCISSYFNHTFCLSSRNFPSETPVSQSMPVRHLSTSGAESGSRKYHKEPVQKRPVKFEHPSNMYPSKEKKISLI
jgi:hypothetical protein